MIWNFKLKILKYSRIFSLHNTLIPNLVKPLIYILWVQACSRAQQVVGWLNMSPGLQNFFIIKSEFEVYITLKPHFYLVCNLSIYVFIRNLLKKEPAKNIALCITQFCCQAVLWDTTRLNALLKSDNLQYNYTLVRWANGTNDSLTKRLTFQVFFS